MSTEKDAFELLEKTATLVEKVYNEQQNTETSDLAEYEVPRHKPEIESDQFLVLNALYENGWNTMSELNESIRKNNAPASRTMTRLYYSYLVDRNGHSGAYTYSLSDIGKEYVENVRNHDVVKSGHDEKLRPWDALDISNNLWYALKAVYVNSDNPTSSEANAYFESKSGKKHGGTTPSISSYLSRLKDKGLVGRTPKRPYRYWIDVDPDEYNLNADPPR